MGNDGGSIPTRRELVKEAARNPTVSEVKVTQQEQQEYLWSTDPVSLKPLIQPVVSDAHGTLYNKETILEFLLDGTRSEDVKRISKDSIKSLKDIVEVKFQTAEADSKSNGTSKSESWVCPITNDTLGPAAKAAYIVPCGHTFSGIAIKEVSGEKCLVCETEYAPNDVIPIISGIETDVARLALRLQTLKEKGLTHSLKKASSKKRKKGDVPTSDSLKKEEPVKTTDKSSGINNSSTASLTAKVLEAQEASKKRKLDNDNVKSLFTNKDKDSAQGKNNDYMTRGFSVPVSSKR